jgi:hypothetical protein
MQSASQYSGGKHFRKYGQPVSPIRLPGLCGKPDHYGKSDENQNQLTNSSTTIIRFICA